MVAEKYSSSDSDSNSGENYASKLNTEGSNKNKNKTQNKNGKNDKHGRLIKQSLYSNNNLNKSNKSNKSNLLLGIFSTLSVLLLVLLGYFTWFFQNQNDILRKKVDVMQNQLNLDLKNRLASASAFENKIKSSFDNLNAGVNKRLSSYQQKSLELSKSVKSNSSNIKQQQKILNSPDGALSIIKHNAHYLMLGSLVNNMNQALSINQFALVRELWLDNKLWVYKNYPNHKFKIDKINNIIGSFLIPNDTQMLEVLSNLTNKIKYLKIIDIKSSYKSSYKLYPKNTHKQLSDINISNSSWWSRQKVASENYISGVWKSIKNSFVVSDNKKAPLLVTQGDRVDAYRIIKQLAIQMQWSIVSNNSKVFIESKDNLIEFINNNMIDDSFKKHWVSELNNLNLPDQSIKMTELKQGLLGFYNSSLEQS